MDWRSEIQRREGESLAVWSLRRNHLLGHHNGYRMPAFIDCMECVDCKKESR